MYPYQLIVWVGDTNVGWEMGCAETLTTQWEGFHTPIPRPAWGVVQYTHVQKMDFKNIRIPGGLSTAAQATSYLHVPYGGEGSQSEDVLAPRAKRHDVPLWSRSFSFFFLFFGENSLFFAHNPHHSAHDGVIIMYAGGAGSKVGTLGSSTTSI